MARLKWNYKTLIIFLKKYGFSHGHTRGSHLYYNGRIKGEDRVVQVIFSKKEKDCQSNKTMDMAVKNSGIPKSYFEEWDKNGKVYSEIIY